MSYATYITEALVCGSYVSNTSDKSFMLFTKEAGMLFASARSVREERSKQRHALQEFSFVRVSLVKGKSGWRIGSVEALGNPFLESRTRQGRTGIAYIVKLLRRYVHGETPLQKVYADVYEANQLILNRSELDVTQLTNLFNFRLLMELGYVAEHTTMTPLLEAATLHDAYMVASVEQNVLMKKLTTSASDASHL